MEVCINELSLTGQYTSKDNFVKEGIYPVLEVLKLLESESNIDLYKTYSLYQRKITSTDTLLSILSGQQSRKDDEIRKFKVFLSRLFKEPYWENNPKHSCSDIYMNKLENVTGSSLAESCERDKSILSFNHNDFKENLILIIKNEKVQFEIDNYCHKANCIEIMRKRGMVDFETYIRNKFKSKLNFTEIDLKNGFNLVRCEDESLFEDAFRLFDELPWEQIYMSDALDYKEYKNKQKNTISNLRSKTIHKFRISQKIRCFGYVRNGIYFVLMFDLTHKLSD